MERKSGFELMQHKGNINRLIATTIAVLTSIFNFSYSQDSLSSRAFKVLNEGLKKYGMNISDIWLPIDTTENNYHRLALSDSIFGEPLLSVDIVKEHANSLLNMNESNIDKYFEKVFDQLEFRKYQPVYYENNLTTKEIDNELGFGTDTTLGIEGGQLFRMFISPVIQIKKLLSEDFLYKKGVRLSFIKDNFKRVLLGELSEDSDTGFDSLQKTARDFFIYSQSANRSMLYANGISLYKTLLKLAQIAKSNLDILKNNIKTTIIETPYGKVALGGAGNDKYEGEFTAILDIGGDDKYIISNSKGGNGNPARFIVDLSGNDTYVGGDFTLGGAAFGINILIDLSGDDIYKSDNFSLGCGVFGVGILNDLSGNDKYEGKIMTQGASAFGLGLLMDNAGNDKYDAAIYGQGLALTKGFGVLLDNFGQDTYTTRVYVNSESKNYFSLSQGASAGYYPYSSGGIGLLVDGRGNDNYKTGICGQGFGYWFGLGGLYDFNGNDEYNSYQFSQGASINNGTGILFDNQGNDDYESEGISQGFANENSFAMLLDEFGNDSYNILNQPKQQPETMHPSISFLLDSYGSSTFGNYIITDTNSRGKKKSDNMPEDNKKDLSYYLKAGFPYESLVHEIKEKYGDFNLSLGDTSVKNYYTALKYFTHDDGKLKPLFDLSQLDFERKLILKQSGIDSSVFSELNKNKPAENIYSMVMNGAMSIEGLDMIKGKIIGNPPRTEFLAGRLGTESQFERRYLKDILSGLLKKGSLPVKNMLVDSSESGNARVLSMCLDLMSENKIYDIVRPISELCKSTSWLLREKAAEAIYKIGSATQVDLLTEMLGDSHPYPRAEAAYSLGRLMPEDVLNKLHLAFYDDFAFVRKRAIEGLTENRQISLNLIGQVLQRDLSMSVKVKFAELVPYSNYTKKELKKYLEYFDKIPVNLRKIIYNSIYKSNSKIWIRRLKELKKTESETELQNLIERLLELTKKKNR